MAKYEEKRAASTRDGTGRSKISWEWNARYISEARVVPC
jgi:hypothetical protein